MKFRKLAIAARTPLLLAGAILPAHAYKDSGVGNRACSGFGKLTAYQSGSGNSWAPGDWDTHPQWNPPSTAFRTITDYQYVSNANPGGGGNWRIVANDTYTNLVAGCSAMGR